MFIAVMMDAVPASDTSACFNEITQRHIPEGCHLYPRRRDNLKSHE
jgi:hypothetical protein